LDDSGSHPATFFETCDHFPQGGFDKNISPCYTNWSWWAARQPAIKGEIIMKRIQTINTRDLQKSTTTGGCGECQTSCQSACKTSCGVANQKCENKNK